jgi:dimethylamine monooxygenase subunit A
MLESSAKARYFPVSPQPLKMVAGLHRLGADFGQAERDRQFFQLDAERPRYLAAKRSAPPQRRVLGDASAGAPEARAAALAWMRQTLAREAPQVLRDAAQDDAARDELDALARALQEDFCVLGAGDDFSGAAALIDVRFPTGWRPERLRDAGFQHIHAPVPGFANREQARSMVRTMVERGPFVRFVWTISPDDQLDHHPDAPRRASWSAADGVWLRVERQVTVPLPAASASVFLIRVYHYALEELSAEQRACLWSALCCMPDELRAYKQLPQPDVVARLFA